MEEEHRNTTEQLFEEPPKLAYYNEAERQEEINKYQKFKQFVCYNKRFTFYDRFYDNHDDTHHQCIKNGNLSHSLLFL